MIIYIPKDIVSGDFYWARKNYNLLYVAVSDCTGHGVPGGFMSLLGITFLNEIIGKALGGEISEVLFHLRTKIIETLHQNNESRSQLDSLEISLLKIDNESMECQWVGAGLPLWIYRHNPEKKHLEEFSPDKMPVGVYHRMDEFNTVTFNLHPGDRIIMPTDGFADQFGGQHGRRFGSARLKELILNSSDKPLAEQKLLLTQTLHDWINNHSEEPYEQIDDITLLAFEV